MAQDDTQHMILRILEEALPDVAAESIGALPSGATLRTVTPHGASLWTRTARVETTASNGLVERFFLKISYGAEGSKTCIGEFGSMSAIYSADPGLVPEPILQDTFRSKPDVSFLLCKFRDMRETLPDPAALAARIANLHQTSQSPNGKFGFHCATSHGIVPIDHGWFGSWEDYFSITTRLLISQEQRAQGPNEEIITLADAVFAKVVPRLLRPLETGGRSIKPSLIHGDLWHGNVATDAETGEPVIFDAAGFYAHNEYELAVWRQPWNELSKGPYMARYLEHNPPAEPAADFDARNALYAMRVNILDSILYTQETKYRDMLTQSLRELVEKVPQSYEEWVRGRA